MVFVMLTTASKSRRRWLGPIGTSLTFLLALQLAPWLSAISAHAGDVYFYVDREGTTHFTDAPPDSRFRKLRGAAGTARMVPLAADFEDTIVRHSRRHRIDPALLRAVIKAESDFDPSALSRAGAAGLMQLMPRTAFRLDVRDPYDPEENIRGGAQYLRYLLDRFNGNVPLALAAYNAGEHRVERSRTLPPINETRRYVSKVLRFYHAFLSVESEALLRSGGALSSPLRPSPLASPAIAGH